MSVKKDIKSIYEITKDIDKDKEDLQKFHKLQQSKVTNIDKKNLSKSTVNNVIFEVLQDFSIQYKSLDLYSEDQQLDILDKAINKFLFILTIDNLELKFTDDSIRTFTLYAKFIVELINIYSKKINKPNLDFTSNVSSFSEKQKDILNQIKYLYSQFYEPF